MAPRSLIDISTAEVRCHRAAVTLVSCASPLHAYAREGLAMSIDSQRRLMREAFEQHFGAEVAEIVMDHLLPIPWADVARQESLDALGVSLRGEIAQLRGELLGEIRKLDGKLDSAIGTLDGAIGKLDGKLDGAIGTLDGAIGKLDGKLDSAIGKLDGKIDKLDGEMRAQFSKFVAANIASMMGLAALMFAAFKVA